MTKENSSSHKMIPLGELVDLQQGLAINKKSKHLLVEKSNLPLLRITDLINSKETQFVDEEKVPKQFIADDNSLIYTRTGQVGLVFRNRHGVVHNNCFKIIFGENLDKDYLYYALKQKRVYGHANQIAQKAAQPDLTHGAFKSISIELHPIDIQKKVGLVLNEYDALINLNERRIKILEEMAQTIYYEWFVDFQFPGHEKVELVDSKTDFGEIPESWKVGTIKDVANLLSGYSFKSKSFDDSGNYQIITIKSVHDGQFKPEGSNLVISIPDKMPKHCILEDGDILLSLTGNVGRTCVVYGSNKLLNQRVAKIDPMSASRAYVYALFRSKLLQIKMQNISNGAAQQNLSPIQTMKLAHVVPSDHVLEMFEELVGPMLDEIVSLNKQITLLKDMRDLLIPKLVTGEIEIKA